MEEELQVRLQQDPTAEEKAAKEKALTEAQASGRERSRSPPRERLLRNLLKDEHRRLKEQLEELMTKH